MLQQGNTGDVEELQRHFGFVPRSLDRALLEDPAREPERWHSGLYFLRPLLRATIALLWIVSGIVSAFFYPSEASFQLLARVGVTGTGAPVVLYGAAVLDILLGLALLSERLLRPALFGQLLVMGLYTLIISLSLPELWLHPFGPITKNLPLMVATLCLMVLEPGNGRRFRIERGRRWTI